MDTKGKNNPNYKHGIHCTKHLCQCGKERDYRAKKCIDCVHIDQEKVIRLLPEVKSFQELSIKTNISRSSVTRIIKDGHFDFSHFNPGRSRFAKKEDVLIDNSPFGIGTAKSLILREKLLKYICSICKQEPSWCDQILVLELDHINGQNRDHRLENLRFLCPNCHSQTNTSRGKNSYGKKKRRAK